MVCCTQEKLHAASADAAADRAAAGQCGEVERLSRCLARYPAVTDQSEAADPARVVLTELLLEVE